MSPPVDQNARDCVFETPVTTHTRKRVHDSVTNLKSHKKRKVSSTPVDLDRDLDMGLEAGPSTHVTSSADRFISTRPKSFLPLEITPRTRRISKQFGLIDERVLNFKDDTDILRTTLQDGTNNISAMALLRRSASSLFNTAPALRPTSVTENLNKRRHCLMVLDSPGVLMNPEAYSITWSRNNLIAVGCGNDVFYQNLDTRAVTHLCSATLLPGKINVIQWGNNELYENYMALGMTKGAVQMWDAGKGGLRSPLHTWLSEKEGSVSSIAWNECMIASGMEAGDITLTDVRSPHRIAAMEKHRYRVLGLQWSTDKNYLASSDKNGIVHVWDRRNGKSLVDLGDYVSRIRHKGAVKALAWCPWKPDLLATGSMAPEGKIKNLEYLFIIITAYTRTNPHPSIEHNHSILHWSPHAKELLSTHGSSFMPILSTRHRSIPSSSTSTGTLRTIEGALPTLIRRTTPPQIPVNTQIPVQNPPTQHSGTTLTAPVLARASSTSSDHNRGNKLTFIKTPLTNSITVHEYPSCKRLMTLTNAHNGPISHSCLGPSGESVFTLCPREEAIKMWQVWSARVPPPKPESAFDKYVIR